MAGFFVPDSEQLCHTRRPPATPEFQRPPTTRSHRGRAAARAYRMARYSNSTATWPPSFESRGPGTLAFKFTASPARRRGPGWTSLPRPATAARAADLNLISNPGPDSHEPTVTVPAGPGGTQDAAAARLPVIPGPPGWAAGGHCDGHSHSPLPPVSAATGTVPESTGKLPGLQRPGLRYPGRHESGGRRPGPRPGPAFVTVAAGAGHCHRDGPVAQAVTEGHSLTVTVPGWHRKGYIPASITICSDSVRELEAATRARRRARVPILRVQPWRRLLWLSLSDWLA